MMGADPAFVPAASSQQAVSTKGFNPGAGCKFGHWWAVDKMCRRCGSGKILVIGGNQ